VPEPRRPFAPQPRRRLAPDERRADIVAAALQLMATRPPESVSMDDVAAAAGSSPALVHHYFGTKQALIEQSLRAAAADLIGRLTLAPDVSASEGVASGLQTYLDFLADHPRSWVALLRAGTSASDPVAEIAGMVDAHVLELVLDAIDPQRICPPTLRVALLGWIALVKEVCLRWLDEAAIDRPALEILIAGSLAGILQAAAAGDPGCESALPPYLGAEG
jgi:AcrR family transcriptional regulator